MNDDFPQHPASIRDPAGERAAPHIGSSTLLSLLEAMIQLGERSSREHKLFSKDLSTARTELQNSFRSFVTETQSAYQNLRKEIHGEKRVGVALLNELMEINHDLEQVVKARPKIDASLTPEEVQALVRWAEAVEVQSRKVQASLSRHGIHAYDAVIGSPYNPALHERLGSRRVEGMGPLLVAEQVQHGDASAMPEFVLKRPQVYVSE